MNKTIVSLLLYAYSKAKGWVGGKYILDLLIYNRDVLIF